MFICKAGINSIQTINQSLLKRLKSAGNAFASLQFYLSSYFIKRVSIVHRSFSLYMKIHMIRPSSQNLPILVLFFFSEFNQWLVERKNKKSHTP